MEVGESGELRGGDITAVGPNSSLIPRRRMALTNIDNKHGPQLEALVGYQSQNDQFNQPAPGDNGPFEVGVFFQGIYEITHRIFG
jgi:hypothetical protein